jgi:flagellar biosynthesis/type III secretory pathway protein FliH
METSDNTESAESTSSAAPSTPGTQRYTELKNLVAAMEADFQKFYTDGNKAAGTRVRGAMQELKNFAQQVRTEVQAIKNDKSS